jgi:hypothetical protein
MKLSSINRVLGWVGLCLVVAYGDDDEPTQLWIERQETFDRRCRDREEWFSQSVRGHKDWYSSSSIEPTTKTFE